MNKQEAASVINSLDYLTKLRTKFSPKRLIQTCNLIKFSSNTIITDLSSIIDKNLDKNDLENTLKYVYNGHCCAHEIENNLSDFSIYFTVNNKNLIGGIFHIPSGKKLSAINIIGDANSEDIIDGQFLYSASDSFFKKLKENIEHNWHVF